MHFKANAGFSFKQYTCIELGILHFLCAESDKPILGPCPDPFCKLVQPSCSCWEGWLLTAHGCPRFLSPPSLQMETPCPPGYLQRSANDWWMWRDRVIAKGQSPCLKEGQLQDEIYALGASALHPPPEIRWNLELTWGYILSFSILLHPSP